MTIAIVCLSIAAVALVAALARWVRQLMDIPHYTLRDAMRHDPNCHWPKLTWRHALRTRTVVIGGLNFGAYFSGPSFANDFAGQPKRGATLGHVILWYVWSADIWIGWLPFLKVSLALQVLNLLL